MRCQETHARRRSRLVTARLWQCCAVGLPAYLYNRLQSVLNAAARSIAGLRRSDHITDTLASFHSLKVPGRIQFKLATIVYRSLNGTAPRYLAADLRRCLICRPDDV